MTVGENIKQIRLNLGLTMEEFGKEFNPSADKSNVSRWEKNKALPSNDRIKRIAELGNVTVNQLLSTSDNEQRLMKILDITYNLIFTSANLTDRQKELIREIKELAEVDDGIKNSQ